MVPKDRGRCSDRTIVGTAPPMRASSVVPVPRLQELRRHARVIALNTAALPFASRRPLETQRLAWRRLPLTRAFHRSQQKRSIASVGGLP